MSNMEETKYISDDCSINKEKIDEEIEKNTKYNTAIAEIREEK